MKVLTPITLPADPTADLEAATKQYVDANAGSAAAEDVTVADVANNFTGTDVEAVLAELVAMIAAVGSSGGGVGPLLIADEHSTPLIFDDILQNDDGNNFLYADE